MEYAIIFLPLFGAIVSGFFGRLVGDKSSEIFTSLLVSVSAILSFVIFYFVVVQGYANNITIFSWLSSGDLQVNWSIKIDALSSTMLVVVGIVSSLVHIYSIGYMVHDDCKTRFMSYLSLFTFVMLTLVTSDNFLQLFFGWEGVGLCSYLLIGFWYKKPSKILNSDNPPFYKWFQDGTTNTCYNAVDLHVKNGNGEKIAIIYDSPITNSQKKITYAQLKDQVSIFAGALVNQGIKKGDRVIIYMPMIPEAAIAMLGCARIGAVHSVVFGGFAANELASRIDASKEKIILSASCGYEPGKTIEYKPLLKKAIELAKHKPEKCIIYQRKDFKVDLEKNEIDWNEFIKNAKPVECVEMNANDFAYILYTSGTTGVAKGIVRDIGGHIVA